MLLCNLHIVGREGLYDIQLKNEKISAVTNSSDRLCTEIKIDLKNAIAFPGLINAHDHLDFNLFPQSGNRIYNNYIEWEKDIRKHNGNAIDAVLKIPKHIRIKWGMYKNLLNGITTVVNHGERLNIDDNFINILQNNYSLHSIQYEKKWKLQLNKPFAKEQTYIIHTGEGTDAAANKEIDTLLHWNLFKRKLIGVHGAAMSEKQAKSFKALIWCPASNYFLFNKTAAIDKLKNKTAILFGTDSTLTASWNLWDHLRLARNTHLLNDEELFESVTSKPASVLNLERSEKIEENYIADIVVAKKNSAGNDFNSFFSLNPENMQLVIHKGEIRLFDEELKEQVKIDLSIPAFSKIYINGKCKYIYGNVTRLINEVLSYYPEAFFPISI